MKDFKVGCFRIPRGTRPCEPPPSGRLTRYFNRQQATCKNSDTEEAGRRQLRKSTKVVRPWEECAMNIAEEVARVAYDLYEKQGRPTGCAGNHWIQALRVVTSRLAYSFWEAAGHTGDADQHWQNAEQAVRAACPSTENGGRRDAAYVAARMHALT